MFWRLLSLALEIEIFDFHEVKEIRHPIIIHFVQKWFTALDCEESILYLIVFILRFKNMNNYSGNRDTCVIFKSVRFTSDKFILSEVNLLILIHLRQGIWNLMILEVPSNQAIL